jgi:hypothetical protein
MTSKVLEEAERQAAAITKHATAEASATRAAAQREAAELRSRLDSMLGDLGQVVAAYISETLATPDGAVAAPARPKAEPGRLSGKPIALPAAMPAGPDSTPGSRPSRPAKAPTPAPTQRTGKPVAKSQRLGRQKNAMRVAKYSTAAMLIFALGAAGVEIGSHGYNFFVFRENGQGDSPGGPTDSQFLSQQAKAAHATPKGKHHAPPATSANQ